MLKGFVLSTAVLVGLTALADRGLAVVAADAAAASMARTDQLGHEPDVTFQGFPFLTQAARGRFQEVDIEARDVKADGVVFRRIEAELRGVEVGLQDALAGEVEAVPVDSGSAVVWLDYADLNAYLDTRPGSPRVSPADGGVAVRSSVGVERVGSVDVIGRGTVSLSDAGIVVTVTDVRAAGGTALPAAATASAATRLSFTVPTGRLPFGISLQGVTVTDEGLRITATANGFVVRVR